MTNDVASVLPRKKGKGGSSSATEGALQMQEQLSHLIAQTTTDAFVAIDPQNRVIYWNRGAEQMLGWDADEIIGQSLNLIVPAIHHRGHAAGVQRLSDGGPSRLVGKRTNVTACHRDGREVFIELTLTHWLDQSTGRPAGYAAIMRDVSERRQLEAERDAYQRKLEEQMAAVEATSDGVAITDPDGFFIYMNPAHSAMFGYSGPLALIGRHWSVLYSPDEAKRLERVAIPDVFASGSWRGEARGVCRDGSIIEQEVALAKSPGGGLVCTTRDMGARQRAIRESIRARESLLLAERQELISRAVSGLVHDFANLMAVISASAANLSLKSQPGSAEVERIKDASDQAMAMLKLILEPNRDVQPELALDARSALATVVELTAVTLRPQHSIRLHVPEDEVILRAAGTEFMRVLLNLCTNARDALPVGQTGFIDIHLELLDARRRVAEPVVGTIPEGPCALITVSDTGSGIPQDSLSRIFKPFQTSKSFGTGLGLAVVSTVVTEAGGSVSVRSGSNGTTFQITWPLADGSRTVQCEEGGDPVHSLSGTRVLVVDDNPSVLTLIESELHGSDVEVTTLESPKDALAVLKDNPSGWDAVILDYDMPEMNGAELVTRIRRTWPDLPIILCTALREFENDLAGAIFDDRVNKSSIHGNLPRALARLLSSTRSRVS